MQDIIFIERLSVSALIGIFEWEKRVEHDLVIDCRMPYSLAKAGQTNSISDTVSYAEVANAIIAIVTSKHHDLLEHLADELIAHIFSEFPVDHIELKLAKPGAVPEAKSVGIIIKRSRD